MVNIYELLKIPHTASEAEIKAAIANAFVEGSAPEAALIKAREWLLNPETRAKYDAKLLAENPHLRVPETPAMAEAVPPPIPAAAIPGMMVPKVSRYAEVKQREQEELIQRQNQLRAKAIHDNQLRQQALEEAETQSDPEDLVAGFHKHRFWVAVCACVAVLAVFMPWFSVPILGSLSGTRLDIGWTVVGCNIIALVIALLGDKTLPIPSKNSKGIYFFSGLATLLLITKYATFSSKMDEAMKEETTTMGRAALSMVNVNFGFYLCTFATIAAIVLCIVLKPKPKIKIQ